MVAVSQRHGRVHFLATLSHECVVLHITHQVGSDLFRASLDGERAHLHPCGGQTFGHGVVEPAWRDASATSGDGEH